MRKVTTIFASIVLIGVLSACSDNNDNGNQTSSNQNNSNVEQNEDHTTENNEETNDNNSEGKVHDDAVNDNDNVTDQMEKLNIEEIEVEAKYADDKEYEAEIEHKSDGTYTAEIENDLEDEYMKGQEAFDKLYPMVQDLSIDEDTGKEEVFDQVLKAFDLDSDYEKLEVEIDLHDSEQELEYEDPS